MILFCVINFLALIAFTNCVVTTTNVVFNYKSEVQLTCPGTGVKFFRNDTSKGSTTEIVSDGTKYNIFTNNNTLAIYTIKKADTEYNYYCTYDTTDTRLFNKQISPRIYLVDFNTLTTIEGYTAELECYLLVGDTASIQWSWYFKNSPISFNSRVYSTVSDAKTSAKLVVSNSQLSDYGYYTCMATNSYGNHSRVTDLKIKSKLAPIWPLLGLAGEFVILAMFILGHQFLNKKKNQVKTGSGNDQANKTNGNAKQD